MAIQVDRETVTQEIDGDIPPLIIDGSQITKIFPCYDGSLYLQIGCITRHRNSVVPCMPGDRPGRAVKPIGNIGVGVQLTCVGEHLQGI